MKYLLVGGFYTFHLEFNSRSARELTSPLCPVARRRTTTLHEPPLCKDNYSPDQRLRKMRSGIRVSIVFLDLTFRDCLHFFMTFYRLYFTSTLERNENRVYYNRELLGVKGFSHELTDSENI